MLVQALFYDDYMLITKFLTHSYNHPKVKFVSNLARFRHFRTSLGDNITTTTKAVIERIWIDKLRMNSRDKIRICGNLREMMFVFRYIRPTCIQYMFRSLWRFT